MKAGARGLLRPDEPPAFEVVDVDGASPLFLLCDHASRRLPEALGDLGLAEPLLSDHIAWDIGAADLARHLSASLDAPLVLSGYSRLVVDANRPLDATTSIPAVTCDVPVPGNATLTDEERAARRDEVFWPYHSAITDALARREARGRTSAIISLHSFTPSLYGKTRPWHVGVMYGKDRRLASLLIEALHAQPDFVVGDNEPYRVTDGTDYGIPTYAERAGRLGVLVEIRQDLLATPSGVEAIGRMLAPVFAELAGHVS